MPPTQPRAPQQGVGRNTSGQAAQSAKNGLSPVTCLEDGMRSKNGLPLPHGGAVVGLAAVGLVVFISGCGGQAVPNPEPQTNAPTVSKPKAADGPGPAVGAKAPAFVLKDQTSAERSLDDLR